MGTAERNSGKWAAAPLLASGVSYRETAKTVGVSTSSISRWMADPEYAAHVEGLRERGVEQAVSALKAATGLAVRTLVEALEDPTAAWRDRLTAAREVLSRVGVTEGRTVEVTGAGGGPLEVSYRDRLRAAMPGVADEHLEAIVEAVETDNREVESA